MFMNKNWKLYLSIIVGILLLLPLIVNSLYLFNSWHQIFEEPSKWSMFWATYLSSIASFAMVFITWRTLKQNKEQSEANKIANAEENEKNRVANELANKTNREINKEENEKNRNLQLNLLKQQNEMQWLNMFRQMAGEYVQLYNSNDLIIIVNIMMSGDLVGAQKNIKLILDKLSMRYAQYTFVRREDEAGLSLHSFLETYFWAFNSVIIDIQHVIRFRQQHPASTIFQINLSHISPKMQQIISENIAYNNDNSVMPFGNICRARIKQVETYMRDVSTEIYTYIQSQQFRINEITEK